MDIYIPKIQEYTIPRVIGIKQCAKEFGIALCHQAMGT